MIVSRQVLAHIARNWKADLFDADWSNVIANWCVSYFNEYGDAPGRYVDTLYEEWAAKTKDKETTKIIDRYLTDLGSEYRRRAKEINPQLVIEQARTLFDKVKLRRLKEEIDEVLENGSAEKGWDLIQSARPVPIGGGEWTSVLEDEEALDAAFQNRYESIIHYGSKSLRKFFGTRLRRGGFITFMGIDKVGKSWWLIDLAWRAMLSDRKVAFFAIGDMTKDDMLMRFGCRAARKPLSKCHYKVPKTLLPNGEDDPVPDFGKEMTAYDNLAPTEAKEAFRKLRRKEGDRLRMVTKAAGEMTTLDISSQLAQWSDEGWDADVVVIDYADLLAPTGNGRMETRDQINEDWIRLRAISQKSHCLLVTATQADAAAYEASLLRRGNFSNDKRKNAHVTAMIGINQDDSEELDNQVQRLNYVVDREGAMSGKKVCYVAGCFAIGNPAIRAYMDPKFSEG
jgi:hypothetical protein